MMIAIGAEKLLFFSFLLIWKKGVFCLLFRE